MGARLLSHWYETQRAASMTAWQKVCDRLLASAAVRRQASIELPSQSKAPSTETASQRYRRQLKAVPNDDTQADE